MAYIGHTGKKECRRNHTFPLLVLMMLASSVLGVCALAPMGAEERISIRRGMYLFGIGLVFFTSLFNFINHVAFRTHPGIKFRKKYRLSAFDIMDISNKVVSSVQAALSCLAGLVVCTYSCTRSFLHTSHYASEAYAWFGASYFFYDIWSMYRVHTCQTGQVQLNGDVRGNMRSGISNFGHYVKTQPIIIMHHLFIGSFGFLVIVYLRGGLGDCVFGYVYLMELSTPFVSLRGVLSRLGLKATRMYVLNGLLMVATFFFCRVMMFPYVCYLHSQVIGLPYLEAIMTLPRGCKIGILILLLPQVYWFWLMLKGAAKVFCTSKPPQPQPIGPRKHRKSIYHHHQHQQNHNS
ncbi:uncharacterized protein CBL_02459 [Carabus blaptoides fortunei]